MFVYFYTMTLYENLSSNQKVRASLHRDVLNICRETSHYLGFDITGQAVAVIAELVLRKISVYGLDLEAFAKHAKRSVINQEDVKLLARRNSSLKERLNGLCKNIPSGTKDKKRKTVHPLLAMEPDPKDENDDKQTKKQKTTDELNVPIPGVLKNTDELNAPIPGVSKSKDELNTPIPSVSKNIHELNAPISGSSKEPEPMDYVETIDLTFSDPS